ncbi:MAG: hypothetical protein JW951_07775 [Lentisphaerae bacterium]|nr:hypothetical protein [Lentisphaerota bacterium]
MIVPLYVWVALAGALSLTVGSMIGKVLLRYRICDAGLITWGQGLAAATFALILCAVLRLPFPAARVLPVMGVAASFMLAAWLLNHALLEGDASTVVPLVGLKIPITALLAYVWLDEAAGPATWLAVLCSGLAVSLFGAGRQAPAQGGHGYRPVVSIVFVILACFFFALADVIAKRTLDGITPLTLLLWSNALWMPVGGLMLLRPHFRRYRVTPLDIGLLGLRGLCVLGGVFGLYTAFRLADGVIVPNVIYGARGFFALAAGYVLNKTLHRPLERQSNAVYALRLAATLLLAAAVFLVIA